MENVFRRMKVLIDLVAFYLRPFRKYELVGPCMVSITWHTRNTCQYTGKKGGFGKKGYVACTGGY